MAYKSNNIRNIAILGHQGSGKTTLVESLYHIAYGTKTKGEVEKKNTISDYLPEEQKRLSSISSSILPIEYAGYKMNLIDVPGNDDFIGEALGITRLIKGAVLVIDATSKVQMGTLKHWQLLRKRNIPTFIYVNKMDKDNIRFEDVLQNIREKLGKNAIPFSYPLGHEDDFDGFVNVIDLKARIFNGQTCEDAEIYEDKRLKIFELHNSICEAVAQTDDAMLEKFFSGESLSKEEIRQGLRKGVLEGELIPVLVGSATKNIGIHTMLQMFIDYMPNPSDLKPYIAFTAEGKEVERRTVSEESFSAYIFKTIVDPYAGILSLFKVTSGKIKVGDEVACYQTGKIEKISTLFTLCGKTQLPVTEVEAGDIAATSKLEGVESTMSLCDPKNMLYLKEAKYPTAVFYKAIVLKNKADENKVASVLQKMKLEEPSLDIRRNVETKQLLIGGLSATHVSYLLEKLKTGYRIDVDVEDPKVVYRESIKKEGRAIGRYVKQSGGSGFYGVVEMKFEPSAEITFAEEVFGGAVPRNYFPAVEKGFYEALQQGQLAGFPVIGVKATLLDGKYHAVDSNEMAFKMAAIFAFKEAYEKCSPIILEPILRITIHADAQYIGDLLSDINARRAKVISMDEVEGGNQEIICLVPEAEVLDYATQLKSLTQGSGFFNRTFEKYEEVPDALKDRVIAQNKLNA